MPREHTFRGRFVYHPAKFERYGPGAARWAVPSIGALFFSTEHIETPGKDRQLLPVVANGKERENPPGLCTFSISPGNERAKPPKATDGN
jgi:hypothetical protein